RIGPSILEREMYNAERAALGAQSRQEEQACLCHEHGLISMMGTDTSCMQAPSAEGVMDTPDNREGLRSVNFGPGFHAGVGRHVDRAGYDRCTGDWSRLFVPAVVAAAEVVATDRILDVATGPGEAAALALAQVGPAGLVVGADISLAMLDAAQTRFAGARFQSVVADGQALPFADGTFDAVLCLLGLIFFPDPAQGLHE